MVSVDVESLVLCSISICTTGTTAGVLLIREASLQDACTDCSRLCLGLAFILARVRICLISLSRIYKVLCSSSTILLFFPQEVSLFDLLLELVGKLSLFAFLLKYFVVKAWWLS